jgi:hypothetical protein
LPYRFITKGLDCEHEFKTQDKGSNYSKSHVSIPPGRKENVSIFDLRMFLGNCALLISADKVIEKQDAD